MRRTVALAALLLVAACSSGTASAPEPAEPERDPALTGRLVPYRNDLLRRVLSVQLESAEPVRVESVRLQTATYDTPQGSAGADLRPGLPVDLRVPYGAVRCGGERPDAHAVVTLAGGREVRVPLADAPAVLTRLRDTECAQLDVVRQVELTLQGVVRTGPDTATATLSLRRLAGDAALTVTELGRSTLLAPSAGPPGGPVVVLPSGADRASVEVTVVPARCDPHALAESKRSTLFRVSVAVGAAAPVLVLVEPPQADRDALVAFAVDSCRGRA